MAELVKVKALVDVNCNPGTTGITHLEAGQEYELDAAIAEMLIAGRYIEKAGAKSAPAIPKKPRENE